MFSGTASAVQVVASNTIQGSDDTEQSTLSTFYSTYYNNINTSNISGSINLSIDLTGEGESGLAYTQFYYCNPGCTEIGSELQNDGSGYETFSNIILGTWNSSGYFAFRLKSNNGGLHASAKNFRLMYDNLTAPNITYPSNNSIINQTVNITWNQIGSSNISYQYQVSRNNFSTIYSSWNTTSLFSRNISFVYYGQYYLRMRTHDTNLDVWSDWGNTTYFSRVNINIIGINGVPFSKDNLTSNHTNIGWGQKVIQIGNFSDNFDDSNYNDTWTFISGSGTPYPTVSSLNLTFDCVAGNQYAYLYTSQNYSNITLFANVAEIADRGSYDGIPVLLSADFPSWATATYAINNFYFNNGWNDSRIGIQIAGSWIGWITGTTKAHEMNTWYMLEAYSHKYNSTNSNYTFSGWAGTNYVSRPSVVDVQRYYPLNQGKVGIGCAGSQTRFRWISALDNYENGSIRSDGWYFNSMIDLGSNNISALLWNGSIYTSGAGGITGVDLYINSSDDNISWTGNVLVQTNATLETYYTIPESSRKRYVKLGFYAYEPNTLLSYPTINNLKYATLVNNYVSGYVKNATSGIPSAKVILYGNVTLTDANGFYSISDIPATNFSLVAGKTGYDAKDNYVISNGTSQTNINFTLPVHVQVPENEIIKAADRGFVSWMPNIEWNGRFNWQIEGVNNIVYADGNLFRGGAMVYNYGYNRTPEFLESTIRLGNYMTPFVISPPWDGVTWDAANDLWLLEHNDTGGSNDFSIEFYGIALRSLKDNVSTNQWNYWNNSLGAFNVTTLALARRNVDKNCSVNSNINNWILYGVHARLVRMELGHSDNITQINNSLCNIMRYTNADGYGEGLESPNSTIYQSVLGTIGYTIIREGYYKNDSFNNTVANWSNWSRKWQLKDGNYVVSGRGSGQSSDKYAQTGLGVLSLTGNQSSNYRFADLAFAKFLFMEILAQPGRFYPAQNFFPQENGVGLMYYANYVDQSTMVVQSLTEINKYYNPTIIETAIEYQNAFDNATGFTLLNGDNTNYSVYSFRKYQQPIRYDYNGNSVYRNTNSTGIYPLNFRFAYLNAKTPSFAYNPEDTDADEPIVTRNFLGFNNRSILIDTNYIDNANISHSKLNLQGNYISINYTGLRVDQSSILKSLDYYNMSAEINDTSDTVHIKYLIGWNSSNVTLTSTDIGIDLMQNNGQTQANISVFGNGLNYSFDTETMNITNITVTNGILQNVNLTCGFTGYNAWGKHNRTCFDSTITGSPWSIEYDVKMSTTNVYELAFNNPPGILDFSPATPYNTTLGENASFWVQFTQPIDYVNWTINGSFVQNHSCPGECQDQYIDTYINSTDLPRATRVVNATGNNSQGNATMSWTWNSPNNPPVQSAIGNKEVTVGNWLNFSMNATDLDSDTITYGTNASNGTLNGYNYSWLSTESDAGTYYWNFNSSDNYGGLDQENITVIISSILNFIPPTPINLSGTQGNFWLNYSWEAGIGNITNSFNISHMKTDESCPGGCPNWQNGSSVTFKNFSMPAHTTENISVFAYNSSGLGFLNSTSVSASIQLQNQNISISGISSSYEITTGDNLTLNANYSDGDGDVGTFADNTSDFAVNPSTGIVNQTMSTPGTYYYQINVSDGYGSISFQNFTVVVSDYVPPQYTLSGTVSPNGSTIAVTGHGTQAGGYYTFGEVFDGTEEVWVNISKTGYINNNTYIIFNNQNIVWNVTLEQNISNPAPNITSWGNDFSNNETLSLYIEMFQNISFNFSSNQTLVSFFWTGATNATGYSAFKNFTSAGSHQVSVYGSNSNGSTQTIIWNISVNNTYPEMPAGAGDLYFIKSKNKIFSNNYTIILKNEITTSDILIDSENIYFYSKNRIYFVNKTSGNVNCEECIVELKNDIIGMEQTTDYIYVITEKILYIINKIDRRQITKKTFTSKLDAIFV